MRGEITCYQQHAMQFAPRAEETISMLQGSPQSITKLQTFLGNLPEYLIYTGAGVLLFDEFLRSFLLRASFVSEGARASLVIALVALFAAVITRKVDALRETVSESQQRYAGIVEVLAPHEHVDFAEILRSSRTVNLLTLSGTKIASLGDSTVGELLGDTELAVHATILLANPKSPSIQRRYTSDEPPTFEAGLEGIERRLLQVHAILKAAPESVRNRIEVRVFDCYPTISILRADDDIYSTTYGFRLRGGDCPKVHSRIGGEYAAFLLKHFAKTYAEAAPLNEWIETYHPEYNESSAK